MSDFSRVERAIRYLDAHAAERPGLAELAGVVGLSEFHFHRLFHRWAGVTPKAFLQYATLARAKRLLRARRSLLDATLELGLSGTGRLHDLFLTLEAMTPGEFKACAAGMTLRWSLHETPFGEACFVATERGLCGLAFGGRETAETLRRQWPGARWQEDPDFTAPFARELRARMQGRAPAPLSVLLKGTPFQLKVWEALLRVPEGTTTTYGALAEQAGSPGASRAVGSAMAANPIAYLIPCHRVIQASGALGGYFWGEARKRAMLAAEHARRSA